MSRKHEPTSTHGAGPDPTCSKYGKGTRGGTHAPVPRYPKRLQVSGQRTAPVFFMEAFGFRPYPVKKTAVAAYLPPISLGEPGSQLGTSLGELGRSRFVFMRTEGWGANRGYGDAFTPSPFNPPAAATTDDVHQ